MLRFPRAVLGLLVAPMFVGVSCLTDFPSLREEGEPTDASVDGASDALVESGGVCEAGGKLCGSTCVPTDDPSFGCVATLCSPCGTNNSVAKCSGGKCAVASCTSGFDNCDGLDVTGCEADLASDSKNCGKCGRDCLGGACIAGKCSPIVVAASQFNCFAVAVDATHVYWTNESGTAGLQRLEHSKSGQPPTVLHAPAAPGDVKLDETHVYWANETAGTVYRLNKQALGSAELVGLGVRAVGVALDNTHVYWTSRGTAGQTDGTVSRALKDGSNPQVLATGLDSPRGVSLDETHAYWTSERTGAVSRIQKGGGSPQMLAAGKGGGGINGWGIVVISGDVIWRDGAFLRRIPTAGGTAIDLRTDQPNPRFMSVDGDDLFWVSDAVMTGSASGLPGAPLTPVFEGSVTNLHGIVADSKYVYYTEWGSSASANGGLYKVARP